VFKSLCNRQGNLALTYYLLISLPYRSPAADVVLDHPSLSRQHAAVCYQMDKQRWAVIDLDSAHGTTINGRPVPKASGRKCI